jgi:hypothetical protein
MVNLKNTADIEAFVAKTVRKILKLLHMVFYGGYSNSMTSTSLLKCN